MLLALALGMALEASQSSQAIAPIRPWSATRFPRLEAEDRLEAAGSQKDEVLRSARACLEEGSFENGSTALLRLLRDEAPESAWRAFGGVPEKDGWRLEWALRADSPPPPAELPSLDERAVKQQLQRFGHDLDLEDRSSYFELYTDLTAAEVNPYARVLDRHFRRLKTQFQAYTGEEIYVFLFAKRSDYLRIYQRLMGTSGEHVLGFYSDDRLFFFDNPRDRDVVLTTATHECTHLLLDRCFDRAPIPLWLHEGMACYFAAECEEALGTYTASLYRTLRSFLEKDPNFDITKILRYGRDGFAFEEYALSWSLIHYLDQSAYSNRFQQYLKTLRDDFRKESWDDERLTSMHTTERFEEAFAGEEKALLEGWRRYFLEEFSLRTERQALDYAKHYLADVAPNLGNAADRCRAVDLALSALRAIPDSADDEIRAERDLLRCQATLENAVWATDSRVGFRLGLETFVRQLDGLAPSVGAYARGELSSRALFRMGSGLFTAYDKGLDLRAAILGEIERSSEKDQEEWRALLGLHDHLQRVSQEHFLAVLASDPLHRATLHRWMFLARATDPKSLPGLFERLRLLAAADPDDENLAALAVAYANLGNRKYALSLLEEARKLSVREHALEAYEQYLE